MASQTTSVDQPLADSPRGARPRNIAALMLLGVGLLQLLGLVTGSRLLRGLGAASLASPLPKVFSDVRGLETYASDFVLLYELQGSTIEERVTPEYYSRMRGPYNRRNVYGAALSYGPRLPENLWMDVFCYGLAPGGPFIEELGIPANAERVRVRIETRTKGRDDIWILEPRCTR